MPLRKNTQGWLPLFPKAFNTLHVLQRSMYNWPEVDLFCIDLKLEIFSLLLFSESLKWDNCEYNAFWSHSEKADILLYDEHEYLTQDSRQSVNISFIAMNII